MLPRKFFPIEKYDNSTEKNEYQFLYKDDGELKADKITIENESIVEDVIDFINFKIIHEH